MESVLTRHGVRTEVLATSTSDLRANAVEKAVAQLRPGNPVALPTETVYGLAADALNPIAIAKIFEAKERPRFDPLIVHLPDRDWLERVAEIPSGDRQLVEQLVDRFWPGPFTIVLPKKSIVPDIVTAGLDTVAIRISAHPIFGEIIRAFGRPLAVPSANRFGRVSPTTAQHVVDELQGRIPLIVDAGPTEHGIESTIVAVCDGKIDILRRGPITPEQLSSFAEVGIITSAEKMSAPGQMPSHYAPKTPLRLIDNINSFSPAENQRVALLAWNPLTRKGGFPAADKKEKRSASFARLRRARGDRRSLKFVAVRQLSERKDFREAAANLFRQLRELDHLELDLIIAEPVPEDGLGAAIMDRLRRASQR